MQHPVAVRTNQGNVLNLRQLSVFQAGDWFLVMCLDELLTPVTIFLEEAEPACFSGKPPVSQPSVLLCELHYSSLSFVRKVKPLLRFAFRKSVMTREVVGR